jgi:hypothetical protein
MDNDCLSLAMATQRVTALESTDPSRESHEAVLALVEAICRANWPTPQQREEAQRLVARLERLRHSWVGGNGEGERPRTKPQGSPHPPARRKPRT